MKKRTKLISIFGAIALVGIAVFLVLTRTNIDSNIARGTIVDSLDGVHVYHNGGVEQTSGRNKSADGYNIGIKYQCVEFVKRYYYQHYQHKMPDSYGHAKEFFDPSVENGTLSAKRGLVQYVNGRGEKPEHGDIIVFAGYIANPYGHVAIVSAVTDDRLEIIQQNYGLSGSSRALFDLRRAAGGWEVGHDRVLGWLRMPTETR